MMRISQLSLPSVVSDFNPVRSLLLVGLLILPGCYSIPTHTSWPTRHIDVEPSCNSEHGKACEDSSTIRQAKKSFRCMEDQYGRDYSSDFKNGYIRAFYDLSHGQKGILPPVPPARYWDKKYRCPEGAYQVDRWYAGYKTGVCNAHLQGVIQCAKIRTREDYLKCQNCPAPSRAYRSTVIYRTHSAKRPIPQTISPVQPKEPSAIPAAPAAPAPPVEDAAPAAPVDQSALLGQSSEIADLDETVEIIQPEKLDASLFGHSSGEDEAQTLDVSDLGFGHAF